MSNNGIFKAALDRTKAYHNSNLVRYFDGVLVPGTEKNLKEFAEENNFDTRRK